MLKSFAQYCLYRNISHFIYGMHENFDRLKIFGQKWPNMQKNSQNKQKTFFHTRSFPFNSFDNTMTFWCNMQRLYHSLIYYDVCFIYYSVILLSNILLKVQTCPCSCPRFYLKLSILQRKAYFWGLFRKVKSLGSLEQKSNTYFYFLFFLIFFKKNLNS